MDEASDTMEGSPTYLKGDIVWVKLSSYWWPGEVINEEDLPGDLLSDFKKPPLVIVKFFDEDSYEYVKNWSSIYPYNADKKSEFIKKGMAGFRSKLSHMAKFPKDIGTAEERTNGNPNILSQPEFLPAKKINYDEIFGTASPKKPTKGKTSLPSTKKTPAKDNNQPHITHRRFLGNDDYRAYICIQYPGKDRKWDSDDEEIKKLNEEPEKLLTCHSCSFKTRRLEVMILHTKMHIQGVYVTSKRKTSKKSKTADAGTDSESDTVVNKSPKSKQRKKKEVKPKTTDVFTNLLNEWDDTDEEMEEPTPTKKAKKGAISVEKIPSDNENNENKSDDKEKEENKSTTIKTSNGTVMTESVKSPASMKNTQDDIKNCFDFDEEEEEDDILLPTSVGRKIPRVIPEKPKPSISELLEQSQMEDELEQSQKQDELKQSKEEEKLKQCHKEDELKQSQKKDKVKQSHHDVELKQSQKEDDLKQSQQEYELKQSQKEDKLMQSQKEDELKQSQTKDELKQSQKEDKSEMEKAYSDSLGETEDQLVSSKSTENGDDVGKKEILKISQSFNKAEENIDENIENTFKELMAETELPALDDLGLNLKPEQNFHDARTVKFPDKGGTTSKGGTASKSGTSKKRFVTSFEDFEAGFRKLEDEERTKKQGGDKEVKITKVPNAPQIQLDNKDLSPVKRIDVTTNNNGNGQELVEVLSVAVKLDEAPIITTEADKGPEKAKNSVSIKETVSKESDKPQIDTISTFSVEQKNTGQSNTVHSITRKTRQSNTETSTYQQTDVMENKKDDTFQEAILDSRRKSSRRRTKQFVIEEDSEEIIEIMTCDNDSIGDSSEPIVDHLDETTKEKLAVIDLEIETLRKNLEATQGVLEKVEACEEILNKSSNKSEKEEAVNVDCSIVVESSKVVESPKVVKSFEEKKGNSTIVESTEIQEPAQDTSKRSQRRSKQSSSNEKLHKVDESIKQFNEDTVSATETSSRVKTRVTQKTHIITESPSGPIKDKEPLTKGRRGRSKGQQKNMEIDEKDLTSMPSDVVVTKIKVIESVRPPAPVEIISKPDIIVKLDKPIGTEVVNKEVTLPKICTEVSSDQNMELQQVEITTPDEVKLAKQESRDQPKESVEHVKESIAPKTPPRSKRGKIQKHLKESSDTIISGENLPTDVKSTEFVEIPADSKFLNSVQPTESETTAPDLALSSPAPEILEPPTPKTRRGRSQKYVKEEVSSPIKESINIAPKNVPESKQIVSDIAETNISDLSTPHVEVHEEPVPTTRRRTRKFSKEKDQHSNVGEDHAHKNLKLEPKLAEQSVAASPFTDISFGSVLEQPNELTLKPRRSKTRKDSKEEEHDKSAIHDNKPNVIMMTDQTTAKLPFSEHAEQSSEKIILEVGGGKKQTATHLEDSVNRTVILETGTKMILTDLKVEDKSILPVPDIRPRKNRSRTKKDQVSSTTTEDILNNVQSKPKEACQEAILKDTVVEANEEKAAADLSTLETVLESDKTRIVETRDSHSAGISEHPTPKSRRSRTKKQVKDDGSTLLEKNATEPIHTKKTIKNKESLRAVAVPSFPMPEEQFSKTRRGRSRKLSKEEEDFARAIEESLKDIAQQSNQVSTTVDQTSSETEIQLVDPVVAVVRQSNDSRKSKRSKSRKHSKSKEHLSPILNTIAPGASVLEGKHAEKSALLSEKESRTCVSECDLVDVIPSVTKDVATDSTEIDKYVDYPAAVQEIVAHTEIHDPTPSTKRGRTRKHSKDEQESLTALSDASKSTESISKEIEKPTAGLILSETASLVHNTLKPVNSDLTVEIIPEQSTPKSKRGRPRKQAAQEATATDETSTIPNKKQAEELSAALEFTKTVLELVENQQTVLKPEVAADTVIQKETEQKVVPIDISSYKLQVEICDEHAGKTRRGRSRKHTENEAVEETVSHDNIPKVKKTSEVETLKTLTVVSGSISSDSVVDTHHEHSLKSVEIKSVFKTKEGGESQANDVGILESAVHLTNVNSNLDLNVSLVKTTDITVTNNKKEALTHSTEDKQRSTVIESSQSNCIEISDLMQERETMGDLTVTEVMELSSKNTVMEPAVTDFTKTFEGPTPKSKRGRTRKQALEHMDSKSLDTEAEAKLAAANITSQAASPAIELEPHLSKLFKIEDAKKSRAQHIKDETSYITQPREADMGLMGSIIHRAVDQSVGTLDAIPKSGLSEWVGELLKISSKEEEIPKISNLKEITIKSKEIMKPSELALADESVAQQTGQHTDKSTLCKSEVESFAAGESKSMDITKVIKSDMALEIGLQTEPLSTKIESGAIESKMSISEESVAKHRRRKSKESVKEQSSSILETNRINTTGIQEGDFGTNNSESIQANEGSSICDDSDQRAINTSDNGNKQLESHSAVDIVLFKKHEKHTAKGKRKRSRKSNSSDSYAIQDELTDPQVIFTVSEQKSKIREEQDKTVDEKNDTGKLKHIQLEVETPGLGKLDHLPVSKTLIDLKQDQIDNITKPLFTENAQTALEVVQNSVICKIPNPTCQEAPTDFKSTLVELPEVVPDVKATILESDLQNDSKNSTISDEHPARTEKEVALKEMNEYKIVQNTTALATAVTSKKGKGKNRKTSGSVQDDAVLHESKKDIVPTILHKEDIKTSKNKKSTTIIPTSSSRSKSQSDESTQEVFKSNLKQKFRNVVSTETEESLENDYKNSLVRSSDNSIRVSKSAPSEPGFTDPSKSTDNVLVAVTKKPTDQIANESLVYSATKTENIDFASGGFLNEKVKGKRRRKSSSDKDIIEPKNAFREDNIKQSSEPHLNESACDEVPESLENIPQNKRGEAIQVSKQSSTLLLDSAKFEKKQDKTGKLNKSDDRKTALPDDKGRRVPPKKSRWSRRGSYAKNDIETDEFGKGQAVSTVPAVSEEVVIEGQTVEIDGMLGSNTIIINESECGTDIVKTNQAENVSGILEKSIVDLNDSEIILPPKKSKRINEVKFNFLNDSFSSNTLVKKADSDILSFPNCDDSIMSTSLRNNIEGLIKDIDSFDNGNVSGTLITASKADDEKDIACDRSNVDAIRNAVHSSSTDTNECSKELANISKCVPPKKKKIEYSKQDVTGSSVNNLLSNDTFKSEEKLTETIPQPPKKKIQKLFESSQALEKLGKANDIPQMSPLAKKKSFLFHPEEFVQTQKVSEISLHTDVANIKESEKDIDSEKGLLETGLIDSMVKPKTEEVSESSLDSKEVEAEVNKSSTVPKKRKKRKSSSQEDYSHKKERRSSIVTIDTTNRQKGINVCNFSNEAVVSQPQDNKQVFETTSAITSVSSNLVGDTLNIIDEHSNKMEVKLEEDDFKFCIQTNLTNLATTTAEELSAIATATLSEIKNEVIVKSSGKTTPVTESEPADEPAILRVKEDKVKLEPKKKETLDSLDPVIPGVVDVSIEESEFVPISLNPTVMSENDLADAQVEITTDKVISEKKPTSLGMFSMDFLESSHVSKTTTIKIKKTEMGLKKTNQTLGTEFTSKAMTKEFDNRPLITQPKAYALKSELLDILEGNSNSSTNSSGSEQKFKTSFDNYDKQTVVQGMFDFEEAIPSQIVLSNKVDPETVLMDSPKLLERLSMSADGAKVKPKKVMIQSDIKVSEGVPKALITKLAKPLGTPKPGQKIIIKTSKVQTALMPKAAGSKPIILSEQIIRPANALKATKAAIHPQGIKRQYEDIEDVETAFIIPKIAKTSVEEEIIPEKAPRARNSKAAGKAKILQQTIISPKGEIVQSQSGASTKTTTVHIESAQSQPDDNDFDINSMPIVLSDDILTPESIQNMPVVLSEDVMSPNKPVSVKVEDKVVPTLAKKVVPHVASKQQIVFKTTLPGTTTTLQTKHTVKPRILSNTPASTIKAPKPCPTALLATGTSADGKPTKYVLVPSTVTTAVPQVKTIKSPAVKKPPPVQSKLTGIQSSEPSSPIIGNKIMIVTNQHGQQTRVVLTPQQQKAFMQAQPGSKTKTIIKGAIPKALLESASASPSGVVQKVSPSSVPQAVTPTVSSQGGLLMTVGKGQGVKVPVHPKKSAQKTPTKPQKTILIKNQMGQTVRKIQGTDDADLDRQVAEQLEAIKASARLQQATKLPEIINYTNRNIASNISSSKTPVRRPCPKKVDPVKGKTTVSISHAQFQKTSDILIPALAPLSPQPVVSQVPSQVSPSLPKSTSSIKVDPPPSSPVNKAVDAIQPQAAVETKTESKATAAAPAGAESKPTDRPLTQLVIQDGLGNQTTITEGQILAIPSETVDGQPQSYMLVTLDEMGNITPLNNEALMSLDPSLGLGGDLNNMVLQVDQGQGTVAALKPAEASVPEQNKAAERLHPEPLKIAQAVPEPKPAPVEQPKPQEVPLAVEQQIVIGEGVLPGADAGGQQLIVTGDPIATQKFLESLSDGSTDLANILANAEGGSVLIQADGQQILIKTNTGNQPLLGISENTEGGGNPIFGSHKPNQDILAAALANTDVFQPSDQPAVHSSPIKGMQSSQLSPSGGSGVLYPMHVGNVLETSLTLSSPIMTPLEVPSLPNKKIDDDVDILNQVPKNVDLPITITDPTISQTVAQQQAIGLMELTLPISETTVTSDINSPSYSYSLPPLEEPLGHAQKPFNSSMPLLTEDVTEMENGGSSQTSKIRVSQGLQNSESSFSSNFGSLPLLPETIESSREEVVKTTCFGEIESLPLLSEDVIEDSSSSIGSSKPARSSPKSIERDIVDEGLSTLGGEMCSSLSEPPPDMFDLASITAKEEEISSDMSSIPEPEGETLSLHSENSGEIPIQPRIVANLNDLKRPAEETEGQDEKRQKFD